MKHAFVVGITIAIAVFNAGLVFAQATGSDVGASVDQTEMPLDPQKMGQDQTAVETDAPMPSPGPAETALPSSDVMKLQIALTMLGHYSGPISGTIDDRGTKAIARLLSGLGLDATGIGPAEALDLALREAGVAPPATEVTGASNTESTVPALSTAPETAAAPLTEDGREIIKVGMTGDISSHSLARLALASRPELLDDPRILAKIYDRWHNTYSQPGDISARTYAAFKTQLLAEIRTQKPVNAVFRYLASLTNEVHAMRYQAAEGKWPIFYSGGGGAGFEQFPLLENDYMGLPKLAIEYPDEAVLRAVTVDAERARILNAGNRNSHIVGRVDVYVTITAVRYNASRNQFTAEMNFEGLRFKTLEGRVLEERAPSNTRPSEEWAQTPSPNRTTYLEIAELYSGLAKVIDGYVSGGRYRSPNGTYLGGIWGMYTDLAFFRNNPDLLKNDVYATAYAPRMLTRNEQERFWRGFANRNASELNQFDRRELAERMRREFGDALRARAIAGPYRFFTTREAVLGSYDFDTQLFRLSLDQSRSMDLLAAGQDKLSAEFDLSSTLPTHVPMPANQARQLASQLNMGSRGAKVFLMITAQADALQTPAVDPSGFVARERYVRATIPGEFKMVSKITGLRIYADQELTRLLYEFPAEAFTVKPGDMGASVGGLTTQQVIEMPLASTEMVVAMASQVPGGEGLMQRLTAIDGEGSAPGRLLRVLAGHDPVRGGWFRVETEFAAVPGQTGLYTFRDLRASSPLSLQLGGQALRMTPSLINADTQISFDADVVARRNGKLFPTGYGGRSEPVPVWLRMRPVSVVQQTEPSSVQAKVAYEILEYFILAGDLDSMELPEILAHKVLAGEAVVAGETGSIPQSPPLTVDLLPMIALMENGGAFGTNAQAAETALDWFMLNRWLVENGLAPGLPGRAFSSLANLPKGPLLPKARAEMRAYLGAFDYSAPRAVEMVVNLPNRRGYFAKGPCGALIPKAENTFGYNRDPAMRMPERREALLRAAGLPTLAEIKAAYQEATDRGSWQKPVPAPVALLSPLNVSAAECMGNWTYETNNLVQEVLGASRDEIDGHVFVSGQMPIVLVAIENFPAALWKAESGFNALRMKTEIVSIHTQPGPGVFPDILVVAKAPEFEKVQVDMNEQTQAFSLTSKGTITPDSMIETPAGKPDGAEYDILGITLDMLVSEADKILRERFKGVSVLRSDDPRAGVDPFSNAWVYIPPDLGEVVTLYVERATGDQDILGIQRVLNVKKLPYPMASIRAKAIEKYGEPAVDFVGRSLTLEWGDGLHDRDGDRTYCGARNDRRERLELLNDENGTEVKWWKKYDWNEIRDSYVPWSPELPHYTPTQPVYKDCGTYLSIVYNDYGMVTFLTNLGEYEKALKAPAPLDPIANKNVDVDF